ncbi:MULTISPECIES: ABC-three component system protein [Paenibacillus]|uniref:ABC-three component system protein n=1 Tax=Paenibacillus TaxID=44249 RepID=UPI0007863559|nr:MULTISPECIES: ABC-three component system protein [Paenibacillus]MCL6661999.1 restriction endonuclease [Paenibacillus amylolyticus]MEC0125502.1 hypothetical protein [Paenibacillus pabuli]UOK61379.1 restriction endonuclease [Paenibacillus sp. OVF10]
MNDEEELEIPIPVIQKKITNADLLLGKTIEPIKRLQVISEDDFEDLVCEWATGYLAQTYVKVRRCGGAGDMGRDVVAYSVYDKKEQLIWDNYQCKHYDNALTPSNIWIELGKLCYYTYIGKYTVPRKYYFVAPKGVSTTLGDLIDEPESLRKGLIANWETKCKKKITIKQNIELQGDFSDYVSSFDFTIIDSVEPQRLIEQHAQTRYFPYRFGGLQKNRPQPVLPPEQIAEDELLYITKLLEAYSDSHKVKRIIVKELPEHHNFFNHFERQRKSFYSAESLMRFERDTLPPGVDAFKELKEEVYDGIIDILESEHEDGFERVKKVCLAARNLNVPSYPLYNSLKGNDLAGICHHLANEDEIKKWVN